METEPTNKEVAVEVGIKEIEVERYRRETLHLGDGSWLVYFSYEMPRELRHHFTGSFTAVVRNSAAGFDARQDG
ncbi:hypothetical protein [Pseudomonas sp.]|uniref:hypothetical protein n=1 Tax=Pseudomonas sp. TaxID=306 RepID=UPI002FC8DEE6